MLHCVYTLLLLQLLDLQVMSPRLALQQLIIVSLGKKAHLLLVLHATPPVIFRLDHLARFW